MLQELAGAAFVVTVGDRTTERMLEFGIVPQIQVVDGVEQRQKRPAPGGSHATVTCRNPAAHITDEATSAIVQAYKRSEPIRILVSGEEDLLVVPALAYAPHKATIMYGQPGVGLVIVKVDEVSRRRALEMMELLERDDDTVAE